MVLGGSVRDVGWDDSELEGGVGVMVVKAVQGGDLQIDGLDGGVCGGVGSALDGVQRDGGVGN